MKRIVILLVTLGLVFSTAMPAFAAGDPTLTEEETASLLYMFEEEKMARDVYNAMYVLWGHNIFLKIATSEQNHMDAVQTLLERYVVPVPQNEAGVFTDTTLAALYTELMGIGSQTLVDALNVGVTIEETDILDLQEQLAVMTRKDILQVYNNLMRGSINHLRSFNKVLSKLGEETDDLFLLEAEMYLGSGNGNGYQKSFEMKVQNQEQAQAQTQAQSQFQNQYQSQFQDQNQFQNQYQSQFQDQYQYQTQTQSQNQDQTQSQYQDQTQSQAGNGECTGDCNCNCGCEGTCDGSGAQNGKP